VSRLEVLEVIGGTTFKATLRAPGVTANPIFSTLWSGSETLVNSIAAVDSGGGYYYAMHLMPNSAAWYVNKWFAFISPDTYVAAQYVRVRKPEVD
jgi:ethanolamine transporter EutH